MDCRVDGDRVLKSSGRSVRAGLQLLHQLSGNAFFMSASSYMELNLFNISSNVNVRYRLTLSRYILSRYIFSMLSYRKFIYNQQGRLISIHFRILKGIAREETGSDTTTVTKIPLGMSQRPQ